MRKRLIFVDDEPLVLDGLRRALHGMHDEWEMKFMDTPGAALLAIEREPYDAIVSDMRMPLMDGAQLLTRVKELRGDMIRIILSGQSKQETILRSIVPAHQFLSKPCDLQELKERLGQAFVARDLLRNPLLASMVSRLGSVPSLPTIYSELSAALQSEDTSLGQIEQIISKDVGMAAKILQLANSAFVGAHSHVSSLREAVSLIGAETVRSLTLSIHVFSQFDHHASIAAHLPSLWNHSVSVGTLAQNIAKLETGSKSMAEECFTGGLLHDIGKIVLFAEMPHEYQKVIDRMHSETESISALEMESLGCTHELVGAYLMSIWGLPVSIVQAVQFHHSPSAISLSEFSTLTAVHCADAIASERDKWPLNHDSQMDTVHLDSLDLSARAELWRALYEEFLAEADAENPAGSHNIFVKK